VPWCRPVVAEGTPASLKAEIGRPSVHVHPHQGDQDRVAGVLSRFGEPLLGTSDVAVRLTAGLGLAEVVRELDAEGIDVDEIELKAPTLDDVFLAKTGRSLEGDDPEDASAA